MASEIWTFDEPVWNTSLIELNKKPKPKGRGSTLEETGQIISFIAL